MFETSQLFAVSGRSCGFRPLVVTIVILGAAASTFVPSLVDLVSQPVLGFRMGCVSSA